MEQVVVNAASRLGFRVEQVRGGRAYAHRVRQRGAHRQPARCPGRHRRSSARSIASTRSRTRRLTSSPRATRSSKACWRTSRRIPRAASPGSTLRIPGQRGAGLVAIYKDGPAFDVAAFDMDGRARPDWADAFRRRRSLAARMKRGRRRRARLARPGGPPRSAARQPPPARDRRGPGAARVRQSPEIR